MEVDHRGRRDRGGVEYYLIEQEAGPADEQLKRAELCLANWKKLRG